MALLKNTRLSKNIKPVQLLIACAVGCVFCVTTPPAGVEMAGWHALGGFVALILACLLGAAPLGILALLLIAVLSVTNTMPIKDIASGFGNNAVWLVLFAFFAAIGFRNTRLGHRIAYLIIRRFGTNPIFLAYSITLCDILIAPFVPNTNARGAGILYPITVALSESLGSRPGDGTEKKIGSYLMMTSFQLNLMAGALFLTAMATNPLATEMLNQSFGITISWTDWLLYACVPILACMLVVPAVLYVMHKPSMTKEEMKAAPLFAADQLKEMGRISGQEIFMALVFLVMIVLWAFGKQLHVDATVAALLGVSALIIGGTITYDDILHEHKAWDILLWLAPLIAITGFLNAQGVIAWIVSLVQTPIAGLSLPIALVILALIYYYVHYLLSSLLVHIQTFFLPFVGILVALGADPVTVGMIFALLTCMSPGTTHYGTGTASIYYSTGYMSQREWWKLGFVVSVAEIIIVLTLGLGWLSILGHGLYM